MLFDFANCRLYDEPSSIDPLSAKKNNLENINTYSNGKMGEIKNFLLLKDEDKILIVFWLIIKKKTTI